MDKLFLLGMSCLKSNTTYTLSENHLFLQPYQIIMHFVYLKIVLSYLLHPGICTPISAQSHQE